MHARLRVAGLVMTVWAGGAVAAEAVPTAFRADVRPLSQVESVSFPALNRAKIDAEDVDDEIRGLPPRFALPRKMNVTPSKAGTWERINATTSLWRYHVKTIDAASLNVGFTKFWLPEGASLLLYSPDGREVLGPITSADNRASRQFWTPILPATELVVEVTIPTARVDDLELEIGQVGQGYRGFGSVKGDKGDLPPDSSGACNMDVRCLLAADPWQSNVRAVAAYTLNGQRQCTGSLVNNTAQDTKLYFATAAHCLTTQAQADTVVTYWNYNNTICRVPGSAASGQNGDGPLNQTISGSTLRATYGASDFTLLELNGAVPAALNQFWAGWDRTPYTAPGGVGNGDMACAADSLCAAIHHPSVADKRITFAEVNTVTSGYAGNQIPPVPGDFTHTWVHWDATPVFPPDPSVTIPPQVTEGGSSGSPLYNAQRRFIGQLHGGPSGCGSTGDRLSDVYGRLSVSWEGGGTAATRAKDWLDPGNTGALTLDGRNQCVAPPMPTNIAAAANGSNRVDVTWTAAAGANSYKVYRGDGACPGTGWQLIADNVTGTSYSDTTVSGNATYAYAVTSYSTAQTCESTPGQCSAATATGVCTLAPTFAGLSSAASSATAACGIDLGWSAGANRCGTAAVKYSVFRSATASFTPDASNRIASCQTGTSYHDGAVVNNTRYHYIVRAEDSTANGGGACNSGNQDANVLAQSVIPAGPPAVSFTDNMESGTALWTAAGSGTVGANFTQVTSASHSPTRSWFAPDPEDISDRTLASASAIAVGPGATLEFWHSIETEDSFDGAVLEYSLDGATWVDILAASGTVAANASRFLTGGYTDTISANFGSPIGGRRAWAGSSSGFVRVVVDMGDFGGRNVHLRWRMATDDSNDADGYWLDDVTISAGAACASGVDAIFDDGFETITR
jgi:lysyl endopeptidase